VPRHCIVAVTVPLRLGRASPRLLVLRPHRLYFKYVARHRDIVSQPHRLYINHAMRQVTPSRSSTTRRPVAPRICRASGRAVLRLDFSSVGHTGSHRASGHSVSKLYYLSPGCTVSTATYVVHPDTLAARQLDSGRINSLPRQQKLRHLFI
jgi:hypothetical protein